MPANRSAIGHVDQLSKRRQVVLDFIDRVAGESRRRPVELGAAGSGGLALEILVMRNLAEDRAHDVENIERRHARPRAGNVEARVGQPQAVCRGADGKTQKEALDLAAIVLNREAGGSRVKAGVERLPHLLVEQQRILPQLLRKHALGEAGDEHDLERAAARLVRAANEHTAVAIGWGLLLERAKAFGEHISRLFEAHRADGAHRAQFAEDAQDARRPAQHAWRQLAKALDPLAPCRL